MHLLFATSIAPCGVPTTGYEIANEAIIGALRRAGARVTVVGFVWPGAAPSDPANTVVLGEAEVRTDSASPMMKVKWLLSALRDGRTFASAKLSMLDAAGFRAAISCIGAFDAFVVNGTQIAGAFEEVLVGQPYIFVAHNVEHRSAEENAASATASFERMLYRREARLLEALETRLCRDASYVFTLAEADRKALGVRSDLRSASLPLITRDAVSPVSQRSRTCEAALIGTWTWAPNRVGLKWYLEEVAPRLRPGFRTRIAGTMPGDIDTSGAGIEAVGRVPDATAFLREAAVVPLVSRAGTGVQLKTIETFELGLPSVATTSSLRGVSHLPENCTVADDPAEFARALEAAVDAGLADVDGSEFHRAQRDALDLGVRRGLAALSVGRKAAA